MGKFWSKKSLRTNIYAVFFTLIFVTLYPVSILVCCVPVYLLRFIVSILARLFRKDLDKMIVTRSSVLAMDDPYKSPKWNICVWVVMEGNLNFPQFRRNFFDKVMTKLSNGKFKDPEYQQYYYKWLGFLFWKWDEHFDINYHMRYWFGDEDKGEGKSTSEAELKEIIKHLTWAPFKREKSPWEFLFIPNYRSDTDGSAVYPKSVLIFRVHHGICDGVTIIRLLMEETNGVSIEINAKPNYFQRNAWSKFKEVVTFPIVAPFQFVKMFVSSSDRNEWHRTPEKNLTLPFNAAYTKKIPLNLIKAIKNEYGVSFTAVVMSAIAGGIRNTMIQRQVVIPRYITSAIPVPMPEHPGKLRNHFIFSFIKLPIGIKDPVRRLKKMERTLHHLKKSYIPLFNFSIVPIIGGLFPWIMRPINQNIYSTCLISNFPGPSRYGDFIAGGEPNWITDMNFSAGFGNGKIGLGFCMISYGDSLRIISQSDNSILPNDACVDQLNNEILKELNQLSCLART